MKPQDLVVETGAVGAFDCDTDQAEGVWWMKSVDGRDAYIHSGGTTYPEWTRHAVGNSSSRFTLTISPVYWNDTGTYLCMDRVDGDVREATLTVVGE